MNNYTIILNKNNKNSEIKNTIIEKREKKEHLECLLHPFMLELFF